MTVTDRIKHEYFEWMCDQICGKRFSPHISFRKLLTLLHDTRFVYFIPNDENRAADGIDLRWRFLLQTKRRELSGCLTGPCSVLEMMVALAIRIEENIMDDPDKGDRTGQWFWGMIVSLGLGSMIDDRFDERFADRVLTAFFNRDYEPNGKGGLFTIRNCTEDLRDVEIWCQANWYLENF